MATGVSRAYVITEETHRDRHKSTRVIGVRSNKKLALKACEDVVCSPSTWDSKEKHTGRLIGTDVAVTYEMFYVNVDLDD